MPVRTRSIHPDYVTAHKVRALTGIGTYALLRSSHRGLWTSKLCPGSIPSTAWPTFASTWTPGWDNTSPQPRPERRSKHDHQTGEWPSGGRGDPLTVASHLTASVKGINGCLSIPTAALHPGQPLISRRATIPPRGSSPRAFSASWIRQHS